LLGVDRKWLAERQSDAIDPTRTSALIQPRGNLLIYIKAITVGDG
jgi:hypothetical protein